MKTIKLAFVMFAAFAPLPGCAINRDATVKVRIVDEDKQPIKGVLSEVMSMSMDDSNSKKGLTDTNGIYSVRLRNIQYNISGYFQKPGYYETKGKFWSWGLGQGLVPPAGTNFTIVLKRIIEPIPMKQKDITVYSPRPNEPVGFDLEIGDWVFPDGKGKISDLLFSGNGNYVSENDYLFQFLAEFPNKLDGIQSFYFPRENTGISIRSELPPPPIAPELGYEKTYERTLQRHPCRRFDCRLDFQGLGVHNRHRI